MRTFIVVIDVYANNGDIKQVADNICLCDSKENLEKYLKNEHIEPEYYQIYELHDFIEAFNTEQINEVNSYIGAIQLK